MGRNMNHKTNNCSAVTSRNFAPPSVSAGTDAPCHLQNGKIHVVRVFCRLVQVIPP